MHSDRYQSDVIFSLPITVLIALSFAPGVIRAQSVSGAFADATPESGIRFRHVSPLTPERHLHLVMGSGLGWIDYDRDGLPDLYAAQGAPFGTAARKQFEARGTTSDRLYRNLGNGRFGDCSEAAGLDDGDYSMGIAAGDFDNDGFPDIYVTNFGRNRLLQNNGDGTFNEAAAESGVADKSYGASCTWADFDGDGNLDLFVCNYLQLTAEDYKLCSTVHNGRRYAIGCHPRSVSPARDVMFRSDGDGRFSDATETAGLTQSPAAQGLGVVAADLDRDGDVDLYVANDSVANDLWINRGDGRFVNEGVLSGSSLNRNGQREAGMGIVAGDVDGDGRPDLFVTNYFGETNTLYRNEKDGLFLDVTDEFGLGSPSRARLGFGTSLFDYDNDGWLDLFVANGHVHDRLEKLERNEPFAQRPQLFRNQSGRRFADVSATGGPYFRRRVVGRSSAVADYDRDGWPDLAIGHLDSELLLLHNEFQSSGLQSVQIELVGVRCNRDAIGAVVELTAGSRRLTRFRAGASGYLSCDEACMTIGVGMTEGPFDVTVNWPGGVSEVFQALPPGPRHVLIEGRGKPQ